MQKNAKQELTRLIQKSKVSTYKELSYLIFLESCTDLEKRPYVEDDSLLRALASPKIVSIEVPYGTC